MQQDQTQDENIKWTGRMFEVVDVKQPDGRYFEMARRAPGVRVIVNDETNGKILLTREFRQELNGYDYRLPGGKVFDSLEEYESFRQTGQDILEAANKKAIQEVREEAGLVVSSINFLGKSVAGASVEWDLYVFETSDWHESETGQQLEQGEIINADEWFAYDEARQMIMSGKMQEDRIAMRLLQWLEKNSV